MKAVTIGGATVDSIAIVDDALIERMAMRNSNQSYLLIEEGRKIEAREISQHCGGGGVNAAVCMARLGLDVSSVLKLGRDERAEIILRRLADEGVSTRWVMRDARAATGASSIMAAHDRDAAIFTFRGANTLLSPDDLTADMVAADLVYIAGLSNEAAECFPRIVDLARDAGAYVATNPGIRQLTRRGEPFFDKLAKIDLLSVNRVEAAALVPQLADRFGEGGAPMAALDDRALPDLARTGLASGGFEMSLAKFCASLAECGVRHVLVTDGAKGAFASDGARICHQPAAAASVVGTAGAGDAFASTFAAWLQQNGLEQALAAAALNAASVVGHVDTQTGLLREADIHAGVNEATEAGAQTVWSL